MIKKNYPQIAQITQIFCSIFDPLAIEFIQSLKLNFRKRNHVPNGNA